MITACRKKSHQVRSGVRAYLEQSCSIHNVAVFLSAFVWPLPRHTPGPSCPYPSDRPLSDSNSMCGMWVAPAWSRLRFKQDSIWWECIFSWEFPWSCTFTGTGFIHGDSWSFHIDYHWICDIICWIRECRDETGEYFQSMCTKQSLLIKLNQLS